MFILGLLGSWMQSYDMKVEMIAGRTLVATTEFPAVRTYMNTLVAERTGPPPYKNASWPIDIHKAQVDMVAWLDEPSPDKKLAIFQDWMIVYNWVCWVNTTTNLTMKEESSSAKALPAVRRWRKKTRKSEEQQASVAAAAVD